MNKARASAFKKFTIDLERRSDGGRMNKVSTITDSGDSGIREGYLFIWPPFFRIITMAQLLAVCMPVPTSPNNGKSSLGKCLETGEAYVHNWV